MLEVKLKDTVEKKVIKSIHKLQFWRNTTSNEKIITIRMDSYSLQYYHYAADGSTPVGYVCHTSPIADFEREYLENSPFVECDSNWQPIKQIELINLKGINYWKNEEGGLYMTMWYKLHGIKPTLIPMNIETSRPVIYPMVVDMLEEMIRLNLYKVSNMRLEEF